MFKQKRFIFDLYKNKSYFDCIAETQRLLYYKNDSINQDALLYFINACYYSGGQYKTVISRLKSADNLNKDKLRLANLFLLSNSYFNVGYNDMSKTILYKLGYSDIDKGDQDKLFINRAGMFIKNYEYKDILPEIENANIYFSMFNKSFTLQDFKNDIEGYREIGLKSKWLSATLSALLPGAGQIYSGRIMDGLLSLAALAGSAYGAYYFYNKKEKPLAITLTFISGLFYCGNIYGAYNSALNTNNKLNQRFANRIINKYNLHYNPMDHYPAGIFE